MNTDFTSKQEPVAKKSSFMGSFNPMNSSRSTQGDLENSTIAGTVDMTEKGASGGSGGGMMTLF